MQYNFCGAGIGWQCAIADILASVCNAPWNSLPYEVCHRKRIGKSVPQLLEVLLGHTVYC